MVYGGVRYLALSRLTYRIELVEPCHVASRRPLQSSSPSATQQSTTLITRIPLHKPACNTGSSGFQVSMDAASAQLEESDASIRRSETSSPASAGNGTGVFIPVSGPQSRFFGTLTCSDSCCQCCWGAGSFLNIRGTGYVQPGCCFMVSGNHMQLQHPRFRHIPCLRPTWGPATSQ